MRQLLSIRSDADPAAGAGQQQFSESMTLMAKEIGRISAK